MLWQLSKHLGKHNLVFIAISSVHKSMRTNTHLKVQRQERFSLFHLFSTMLVNRWITKTIFSSLPLLSCAFSSQFIPYKVTFQTEAFIRYPVDIAAKTSFLSTNIVPFWPKRWRDSILSFSKAPAIKLCLAPSWNYSNYRTNSKQPIRMLRSWANAASTKYTVFLAGPQSPPIRGPARRLPTTRPDRGGIHS